MRKVTLDTPSRGTARSEDGDFSSMSDTARNVLDPQLRSGAEENQDSYGVPFPIAIVGFAMKLPGGVNNAESLWEMLVNKKDGHCEVPKTRYNIDAFYNGSESKGLKSRHGYFLQENIARFDRSFFGMAKNEVRRIDPQQRLLMEVVMECMENSGQRNWRGRNIGCFIGVFGEDWLEMSTKDVQAVDPLHAMNTGDFALANRLSYEYDLRGPSITYRTACSSSMVGLHEACQAIYSGECESAIVGGSNLILAPTMTTSMSSIQVLSPSGVCRTFDADADGYGRGEAINVIHIKPLADAIEQGDNVRAVIRSTATNCDGRTQSIVTPGVEAQERLIRRAYLKAGIEKLSQTAFFECHGTGTTAGDTAETGVIGKIFQDGIYIGGVKPNLGHSEGASGLTSIIKAVLALEKGVIPPNAHFSKPNPKIPFEEAKLKVPVEAMAWPEGKHPRISVNCFGIGGTNVHAIVESFSPSNAHSAGESLCSNPRLLVLSTKNENSLDKRVNDTRQYVAKGSVNINDLAYTLGARRDHMAHRAFAIIDPDGGLSNFEKSQEATSSVAFVFSGQGAQWIGMGKELLSTSPCFCSSIRTMDQALTKLENPPDWKLEDELLKDKTMSRISDPEFCQPLCTAVQIALTDVLRAWGILPDSVIGHSSGEIAAAYASGAIDAQVAMALSYYRGQAIKQSTAPRGGMAAIGMSPEKAKRFLRKGLTVACENSPQSVTLSGDEQVLAQVVEQIQKEEPDAFCRRLDVSVAYHSESMKQPGTIYENHIKPIMCHSRTMIPLYSTVTGTVISDPSALDAAYWRSNLHSPVLFNDALQNMIRDSVKLNVFVEIGPHSALARPIAQILRLHDSGKAMKYVPTLVRNQPQQKALLVTAGRLHSNGYPVDLSAVNGKSGKVLTDLPSYPWVHEEDFWTETRVSQQWRSQQHAHHELLGSRCLESAEIEPSWRNILHLDHVPWLLDHAIGEDVIFPCAGYIAMAGEAIRQVTGSEKYTIRNLVMQTPLAVRGFEAVEILTNLRPVRLTDTADSTWFEICIMAYNNRSWKKHCVCQASAGTSGYQLARDKDPYPRSLPSKEWYSVFKKFRSEYGPEFQRLENISANPSGCQAVASVQSHSHHSDENISDRYALHPTLIDQNLQLLVIASIRGIPRHLKAISVPIAIESIDICPGKGLMSLYASCSVSATSFTGNSNTISCGDVILSMKNATLVPVEKGRTTTYVSLIARLAWKPHVDLIPSCDQMASGVFAKHLADSIEDFTHALIKATVRRVRGLKPSSPHLEAYQAWLTSQVSVPLTKSNGNCRDFLCQEIPFRESMKKLELEMPQSYTLCSIAQKISELSVDLMNDQISPQDVADENYIHKALSEFIFTSSGFSDFFHLVGHSNPDIRILLLGIGDGFALTQAFRNLVSENGIPMYEKFTVADPSTDCIHREREKHQSGASVEYVLLDFQKDLVEQGLEPGGYDLIIASEAFYEKSRASFIFANIHAVLAPGGRILYQEPWETIPLVKYVMGIFPTWWKQQPQGHGKLSISSQDWQVIVQESGFAKEFEVMSTPSSSPIKTTILSKPHAISLRRGNVILLYLSRIPTWAQSVGEYLIDEGYNVTWIALGDTLPWDGDVISFIDLEGPFFDNMSQESLTQVQLLVTQMVNSRVLWITESSQMSCSDPRFGLVLGFARTIRHEITPHFATLEIDNFHADNIASVFRVLQHIQQEQNYSRLDPDREFAVRNGVIHVSRIHWTPIEEALHAATPSEDYGRALDIGTYGLLGSLAWREQGLQELEADDVEVDLRYCSLNFRDIMVAMGVVGDKSEFGIEGAGLVRRVGSSVKHVQAGQEVVLSGQGLLRTRPIVPSHCCFPLVPGLSLVDAATVPSVYATVLYALTEATRIQEGQSILIHSACGGVGLAAIQLCQLLGVKIFATVGSENKAQYLVRTFEIPRDHIFDSRSPSFYAGLMEQTNYQGVDVVLNSLAGELLHTSWRCVAKFGKMIELGKRDMLGHAKLDMDFFAGNRSFIGLDIMQVIERPSELRRLMQKGMEFIRSGKLKPIQPITFFDAVDISKAFGYMQTGKHIGKVLITMPHDASEIPVSGNESLFTLDSDASYLLVGGLGGLGRRVATWMVEKGARNIVFLGRSAGRNLDSISFIEELESQGCSVTAVSGSVENIKDVQRAVQACRSRIGGVLQMSMVIRSQLLSKMTHDEWATTLAPKVQGTWNLHHALLGHSLDFFICFGSLSGLCGNHGQAHYAAANTFLDAFVKYRQRQNLVASVIDIGLMDDAGFAYENMPGLLQRANSASVQTVTEIELLRGLELAMRQSGQFANGLGTTKAPSDPGVTVPWSQDARYGLWKRMISSEEQRSITTLKGELKELVEMIQRDPQVLDEPATETRLLKVLGREIGAHVADNSCMEDSEICNIVIESLLMIEIKNWARRHLGLELSLADISNASTIGGFAKAAISALRAKYRTGDADTKTTKSSSCGPDEPHLRDLMLGQDLHPIPGPVPNWHSGSEGHVLLTGSTGFLGAFMLSMLSDMPEVHTITCLIRASDNVAAKARLDATFEKFNLSLRFRDKIQAVTGDLSQEYLGVGATEFANLAEKCSTVFHIGASVNFTLSYSAQREANVLGLVRILGFANTNRLKSVHYFSSLAAYGPLGFEGGQKNIPENQQPLTAPGKLRQYSGYPLSKYVAETICWDVIANGFPLAIYRPGLVLGHSVSGMGNRDDAVNTFMSTCIRLGAYPHPPSQRNNFVPVDFVCSSALHIASSNENLGQAYNLIHPTPGQNISLSDTFSILRQFASSELRSLPFPKWLDLLSDTKFDFPGQSGHVKQMAIERSSEWLPWWENEEADMFEYGTENLHKALTSRPEILQCRGMSDLLKVYFKQWSE